LAAAHRLKAEGITGAAVRRGFLMKRYYGHHRDDESTKTALNFDPDFSNALLFYRGPVFSEVMDAFKRADAFYTRSGGADQRH
jgi:hypothetical protein